MQNGTGYPLNLAAAVQNLRVTHTTPMSAQNWPDARARCSRGPIGQRNAGSCGRVNTAETGSPGTLGAALAGSKDTCAEGLGMRSVTAYNLALDVSMKSRKGHVEKEKKRECVLACVHTNGRVLCAELR